MSEVQGGFLQYVSRELGAQVPTGPRDWHLSLEDPLEKKMANHSSTVAWEIHRQMSPVGYSSWGLKESDTT